METKKVTIEISGCQNEEHFEHIAKRIYDALKEDFCPYSCNSDTELPNKCSEDYCEYCVKENFEIISDDTLNLGYEMED